jgi:hypothetical protein
MSARGVRAFRCLASREGTCEVCKQRYRKGEPVFWIEGRAVHISCPQARLASAANVIPLRPPRAV